MFFDKKNFTWHDDVMWRHDDVIINLQFRKLLISVLFDTIEIFYVSNSKEHIKTQKMRGQPLLGDILIKSYDIFKFWPILMTSALLWRHYDIIKDPGGTKNCSSATLRVIYVSYQVSSLTGMFWRFYGRGRYAPQGK